MTNRGVTTPFPEPHQLDARRGQASRVICTCECLKTAEVDLRVASAGVAQRTRVLRLPVEQRQLNALSVSM